LVFLRNVLVDLFMERFNIHEYPIGFFFTAAESRKPQAFSRDMKAALPDKGCMLIEIISKFLGETEWMVIKINEMIQRIGHS